VVVDKSKRIQYLNRPNETSQNVLVVCDFDMRFTFIMSRCPGSAHDMRVFKSALSTHHNKFPHATQGLLLQPSCAHFYSIVHIVRLPYTRFPTQGVRLHPSLHGYPGSMPDSGGCGLPKPSRLLVTVQVYKVPCAAMAKWSTPTRYERNLQSCTCQGEECH
jgi:hypothetical protein